MGAEGEIRGHIPLAGRAGRFRGRRRVMIFVETVAAMGAEGEIWGHFTLAVRAGGFRRRRRGRLRGRLERVLILSGYLRAGLAQLGHELSQGLGILRQFLRPKEDKGQYGEDDEFLE
jgi:hypothetical protein